MKSGDPRVASVRSGNFATTARLAMIARDSLRFFLRPPEARIHDAFVIRAPELAGLGPAPELQVPLALRTNPDTTLLLPDEEPVISLLPDPEAVR